MRVVVDTNVFISAALKDNSTPALAVRVVDERDSLLKSDATEQQLFEVLARTEFVPLVPPETVVWFRWVLAAAELVTISERIEACRDPSDDKFLELAVNGKADLIVSGDHDLRDLNPFRGIRIITPADFVKGAAE